MTIAKAIAQAWSDPAFKDRLVGDPIAALAEHGVGVPPGTTVRIIENTDDVMHIVLPVKPADMDEMPVDELEKVAGGRCSVL